MDHLYFRVTGVEGQAVFHFGCVSPKGFTPHIAQVALFSTHSMEITYRHFFLADNYGFLKHNEMERRVEEL